MTGELCGHLIGVLVPLYDFTQWLLGKKIIVNNFLCQYSKANIM